jgi:hypothetical protein
MTTLFFTFTFIGGMAAGAIFYHSLSSWFTFGRYQQRIATHSDTLRNRMLQDATPEGGGPAVRVVEGMMDALTMPPNPPGTDVTNEEPADRLLRELRKPGPVPKIDDNTIWEI